MSMPAFLQVWAFLLRRVKVEVDMTASRVADSTLPASALLSRFGTYTEVT
jgi:hypothetical protein